LWVIRIFVLHMSTKFEVRRPSQLEGNDTLIDLVTLTLTFDQETEWATFIRILVFLGFMFST